MIRSMMNFFLIGLLAYAAFQNRYRLLNLVLTNGTLRRFFVSKSMNLPGVREKMMSGMFNQPNSNE
ncbi:hypothetical protein [Bacillus massiliglaciei]|uniref:hypothetical protein n=1 Tax=Bacillus massiliglaciei TaxID=1816693 RepID=UPI000DA61284|nr:hypothetical protein [Bacillus massiliglaciei]